MASEPKPRYGALRSSRPGFWRAAAVQRWKLRGGAAWILVLLAIMTGLVWRLGRSHRGPDFPRHEGDFPSPAAIDARLEEAQLKVKDDPNDIASLVELGILHYQKGQPFYPDAINELEEAWRLGSLDSRLFYYLGALYQGEGLYPFSIVQYQRYLRNHPRDADAALLLGKLLYQTGRHEEALAVYQALREMRSGDPIIAENMAMCLLALKRPDEAKDILADLTRTKSPVARRAHFYLGQIAFEKGLYREALPAFVRALPADDALGLAPAAVHAALASNF
ncbi:MAG: tetratricopeptide repeat protein, partial [Elusimicrobia bacterium]|nr:tetratricopeptide repeat protein [Elusimicrobiota bacterium]